MSQSARAVTPQSVNRYALFLIVIVLSELTPALPHRTTPNIAWWLSSIAIVAALTALGYLGLRRPRDHWLSTVAPLMLYPAIHTLRCADGNSTSGFTPLIFLPVIWFALYGRMRDLVIAVGFGAVTVFAPMIIVGSPQYPGTSWRGSLLLVIMTATLGPLIYRLVETAYRANRALTRSESEFRAAFDNAPVAMAVIDLRAADDFRFVRANRAMCELIGRSDHELRSEPINTFTHPADQQITTNSLLQAKAGKVPHRVEKRYLHRSGRAVWVSITYSVVNGDDGLPSHLLSQIQDLDQRRESDEALLEAYEADREAAQRLKQLDRVRAEMASTVSHELRTPLTSAAGYVELLAEGDAGPLTDEQRLMLGTVQRSLSRLDGIVGDVLDMANSRTQGALTPVGSSEIGGVIRSAIDSVALQAASRGQTLIVNARVADVKVVGESGRLERLLINLLTNAMKFTPDDGTVTVTADVDPGEVVVAVSDTGVGISDEDQKRIFERFFRADRVIEAMTPGTGLGLSIVEAIVTQYGGTVAVDSELGEGSTFTVSLPILAG